MNPVTTPMEHLRPVQDLLAYGATATGHLRDVDHNAAGCVAANGLAQLHNAGYRVMPPIDLDGRHPCPVPGCYGSAEEHHRVNVGLVAENADLRRKLREVRPGAVDLGGVSGGDLLAELEKRVAR